MFEGRRSPTFGAEIDEFGDIHILETSRKAELKQESATDSTSHIELKRLLSASAGTRAHPGRASELDRADVVSSIRQFYGYWHPLNEGESEDFLATVTASFGLKAEVDGGRYQKVWAAAFGRPVGRPGRRPIRVREDHAQEIQRWDRTNRCSTHRDLPS